jgi:hypothetical protein
MNAFDSFDILDDDAAPPRAAGAQLLRSAPGAPALITIYAGADPASLDAVRAAYLAHGRTGPGPSRRLRVAVAGDDATVEIDLNLRKFQPDDAFADEILAISGVLSLAI